jgi:REP element-mobilizing transposase RayT
MVRGINKTEIFSDEKDKEMFMQRLGAAVIEGQCAIYAWAVMDNHSHILIRSGKHGISDVMRKVLTWYAQYYNRRHNRTGHLFENRYKSILCEEERYLLALVRYIHLNPIRAKVVVSIEELDRYSWTGHQMIMGKEKNKWMDTGHVLAQFGETRRQAIRAYRKFMTEGLTMGKQPELSGGGMIRSLGGWSQVLSQRRKRQRGETDERILGSGDFVSKVLKEAEERQRRQTKLRSAGKTVQKLIGEECGRSGISIAELRNGSRRSKVSEARMVIAYRCREELGISAAESARQLGVNTSSIIKAIERYEQNDRA